MRILQRIQVDFQELNSLKIKPDTNNDNIYYKRDNLKKQINNYMQNDYIKTFEVIKDIYDIINSLNINIENEEDENLIDNNNSNQKESEQKVIFKQQLLSKNEFLDKRGKDLQKIQETAAKINALSENIKAMTYEQGEQLDFIQNKVEKVDENIEKAMLEIQKAKKTEKSSKKKLYCIIFWAFFVICAIIGLLYIIFRDSSKK
jgi:t-SNARE complex subunit (syntaxin)